MRMRPPKTNEANFAAFFANYIELNIRFVCTLLKKSVSLIDIDNQLLLDPFELHCPKHFNPFGHLHINHMIVNPWPQTWILTEIWWFEAHT